ncbi:MAG TPA: hypothetical protein VFE63_05945 [Roseiarcus sp.]|nr:hypothetical protein [Roseiarcus sp.]
MGTDNWMDGSANWDTEAAVPTSTSKVDVAEGDPKITRKMSIASLVDSATITFADPDNGVIASAISGGVDVSGQLLFDAGICQGGSSLKTGGPLTNSGTIDLGNRDLAATDTVQAAALDNTGTLDLVGGVTADREMQLDITGAAGVRARGRAVRRR